MSAFAGYQPLELGFPGTPACPDNFSEAATVYCGGAGKLRVQSSLGAVVIQFGQGIGGVEWGAEEVLYPTQGSIVRAFDAVRVRNRVAGVAAQVALTPYPGP